MIVKEYTYQQLSAMSGIKVASLKTWFEKGYLVASSATGCQYRFTEAAFHNARGLSVINRPKPTGIIENLEKSPIYQKNKKIKAEKEKAKKAETPKPKAQKLAPIKEAVVIHKNGVAKAKKGA